MRKLLASLLVILCLSGCAAEQVNEPAYTQRDKVIIALLDTGVSTTAIQSDSLHSGHNYVTDTEDTEDSINHGTAVASVILGCESAQVVGIAPDIALVPLAVTDKVDGEVKSVSPKVLAQAIRDSVDKYGACIINVSLGIQKDDPAVKEAVAYVQKQGALVICAAGNSGDSEVLYYPAAYEGVLTVGSHDKNLKVSGFTQQNGTVDILAPGEDIWLASRSGKTYGARGTSYATGFVSGAAALVWQSNLALSADEVVQILLKTARTAENWRILDVPAALEARITGVRPENDK